MSAGLRPGVRALALALALVTAPAPAADLVDSVLADVDGQPVTASDIALARAIGLHGFEPAQTPIMAADVERYVRVRLVLAEARRLAIEVSADELGAAWEAAAARAGGPAALEAWLDARGIDRAWARRGVEDHVRWRRFIELRFVALAFVTPDEVTAALGSDTADAAARARAHDRLRGASAERALAAWLDERASLAAIRRTQPPGAAVPLPFAGPRAAGR